MALAGLGTIGVGATSGAEPGGSGTDGKQGEEQQGTPSGTRIVAVMLLLCAAVAALPLVLARRTAAADRRARSAKPSASVYGLQARLGPQQYCSMQGLCSLGLGTGRCQKQHPISMCRCSIAFGASCWCATWSSA